MSAAVKHKPRKKPAPVDDPRKGLNPAEQIAADLHRFRAAEIPFERAWALAWDRIRWPHNTTERKFWKALISVQRRHWHSAFDGELEQTNVGAAGRLRAAA